MAGEAVTAMIVADDAGDNPLADRREDREAAAERERKAKVAKVASQSTNAIAAVRAQLDLREKGAADKAANKANDDAGAPVRASSKMVERVFASRLDGPDKAMVARLRQRKTASGAGTGDEIVAGLEKLSESVVQMAGRDGADGITVTGIPSAGRQRRLRTRPRRAMSQRMKQQERERGREWEEREVA